MVSRRRIWGAVLFAPAAQAQPQDVEALRAVAAAHGVPLTDDRLRLLKPVLESRKAQLAALRAFAIADTVEPTQGIRRQ